MLFINVKHFNKLKNKITIKNSILKISQFWLFPLLAFFFDSITAVRCKWNISRIIKNWYVTFWTK